MTPLETFMLPGRYVLELLLTGYLHEIDPTFIAVIAGVVSWIIWGAVIRISWAVTLRLFGFGPQRRY